MAGLGTMQHCTAQRGAHPTHVVPTEATQTVTECNNAPKEGWAHTPTTTNTNTTTKQHRTTTIQPGPRPHPYTAWSRRQGMTGLLASTGSQCGWWPACNTLVQQGAVMLCSAKGLQRYQLLDSGRMVFKPPP
jgi:hypothetical protein